MNYSQLASDESIARAQAALKDHNFASLVVDTKEEALAKIKEMVPAGASIMNGASRTLEEIGFVDFLKSGVHGWDNVHDAILAEKDPAKQSLLRRQSAVSDYYLGSAHAISETGEIVFGSNTGSQLPHLVFTSPNIILVIGAQKLTPTLEDARSRLREHVIPLEDENMKQKYGMGTMLSKELILHRENPMMGRSVTVMLVKQKLGF